MDHRKLRYFIAVAEERSLRRAAERLHLSQPALTRAMQDLEGEVGARLFARHSRGIALTSEGEILLLGARDILQRVATVQEDVAASLKQPRGTVAIGVPPSLSVLLLAPLAESVAIRWPQVVLTFHERLMPELLTMVAEDRLDLAIVGNPRPGPEIRLGRPLREEVCVLSLRDAGLPSTVEPDVLAGRPLIVATGGVERSSWFDELVREAGLQPEIRFSVEAPALSIALVRRGLGHAVLPRSAILGLADDASLSVAVVRGLELTRFVATSAIRPLSSAAAVVLKLLEDEIALVETRGVFRACS